jgi:hypothetical protein
MSDNPPAAPLIDPAALQTLFSTVATQTQAISNLTNQVTSLLAARINPDGTSAQTEQPLPPFVAIDAPSESLYTRFPTIESSVLLSIAQHTFHPTHLYKLEPRWREMLDTERVADSAKSRTHKDFPTLASLLAPLAIFFRILTAIATSGKSADQTFVIANAGLSYINHLMDLSDKYQWPAVVAYHLDFHLAQRLPMKDGNFTGWLHPNIHLQSTHLFSRPKSLSARMSGGGSRATATSPASSNSGTKTPVGEQVCYNHNKGTACLSIPCPRRHVCRKCHAQDHIEKDCPT